MDRHWIGIDITHLAISLQKYRLKDMFDAEPGKDYKVIGEPQTYGAAVQLANDNRFQFEWWALSLVKAKPSGVTAGSKKGKKGADKGIDGIIHFIDDSKNKPKKAIVQVKSGHVTARDIRDLKGTVDSENAAIGVLVTLEEPTKPMKTGAATAGFYSSPLWEKDYPRIQILTIEELLDGVQIDMPPAYGTFKQAERVKKEQGKQTKLFD